MTATRLRNLKITRIDLVDKGASEDAATGVGARVVLFKSADPLVAKQGDGDVDTSVALMCKGCGAPLGKGMTYCAKCGTKASKKQRKAQMRALRQAAKATRKAFRAAQAGAAAASQQQAGDGDGKGKNGDDDADDDVAKAELSTAERNNLPDSAFAAVWTDAKGKKQRALPIHDAKHVRAALGGHGIDAADLPAAVRARARAKILAAAKKFGIDVSSKKRATAPPAPVATSRKTTTPPPGGSRTKKSLEGKMDLEKLKKAGAEGKEAAEYIEQLDAQLHDVKKQLDALKKSDDDEPDPDADLEGLDEGVKDVIKSERSKRVASDLLVASLQEKLDRAEFRKAAEDLKGIAGFTTEQLGDLLYELDKATRGVKKQDGKESMAERVKKALTAASKAVLKSPGFREAGSSNRDLEGAPDNPQDQLLVLVNERIAKGEFKDDPEGRQAALSAVTKTAEGRALYKRVTRFQAEDRGPKH